MVNLERETYNFYMALIVIVSCIAIGIGAYNAGKNSGFKEGLQYQITNTLPSH